MTCPSSSRIYSPEASDFSPYGDWQSKVGIAVFRLLVIAIVLAMML